ncbi:MAG TPA: hypothetical protein VMM78_02850, partial [Thermomicrobiales bacterium]|nr:hypothetical protein [Thermomicrobiales bacterium]
MPSYFDLGEHTRAVTTASDDAQLWFDLGLNWTFGFNHEEAVRCFERAIEADPGCAMAYWGVAYANGPNYNKPWEAFDEVDFAASLTVCFAATERARALMGSATPAEQSLIAALQARYPTQEPSPDWSIWNDNYADAMRAVYQAYADDLDVASLFAEALINRTPWQLWDLPAARPAEGASTVEAQAVLERALADPASSAHPGVLHMYIHLMEMSPHPERALPASDLLRGLVPDAGHLQHMPTHIDVLCGHYHNVVA